MTSLMDFAQTAAGMRRFHFWFETLVSAVAICLNLLLLRLIATRSSRNMRDFRTVLQLSTVVDLFFTTVNMITMESIEVRGSLMYLFDLGWLEGVGHPAPILSLFFWELGLLLVVSNVAVQFVYRYFVVCHMRAPPLRKFAKAYAALFSWCSLHCFLFFAIYDYGDPTQMREQRRILRMNPLYANLTPLFAVTDTSKPVNFMHMMNAQLTPLASYITAIWAGWKTWRQLRATRQQMSPATRLVQSQITKIMVLQGLYPMIFLMSPIILVTSQSILGYELPLSNQLGIWSVACLPLLNPLSVILIVPSYRRVLLRLTFMQKLAALNGAEWKLPPIRNSQPTETF